MKKGKWIFSALLLWVVTALLVSLYLRGSMPQGDTMTRCLVSGIYVLMLVAVLAIGNFACVRTLLCTLTVYGIAMAVRGLCGFLGSLLFMELPVPGWLGAIFDLLVYPFQGLMYISGLLTAHFVSELYWMGLTMGGAMLIILSCVAFMSVGNRLAWERSRGRRIARRAAPRPRTTAKR